MQDNLIISSCTLEPHFLSNAINAANSSTAASSVQSMQVHATMLPTSFKQALYFIETTYMF